MYSEENRTKLVLFEVMSSIYFRRHIFFDACTFIVYLYVDQKDSF